MQKPFMTAVMLCGALVSGCQGVEGPQPPQEPPGDSRAEAPVASTTRTLVSPELEAALTCVETYVNAGTCDWTHWSELWETCRTYEHQELEDGVFIEAVQSGDCTADNWTALRERLLEPTTPRVRVRAACDGDAPVIQETTSNGCYPVEQGTGASFVDVPVGKVVTLSADENCTGDSVTVDTDTSLCETVFESGASANGQVRSLRIEDVEAPPSPYRYECTPDEPTCVQNYNGDLGAINKKNTVKVVRVTLAGRTTATTLAEMRNSMRKLSDFFTVASRNQLSLEIVDSRTVAVTSTGCNAAKRQARQRAGANAFVTVFALPRGLCGNSGSGSHNAYLLGNLFRDYAHEVGHVLGLQEATTRDPDTGIVTGRTDSSSFMSIYSADNYNLPQLHWLGWTKKEEIVKVNSALDANGFVDVTLRPVGDNAESTSNLPLGAVWEMPGTNNRLFVAVPKSRINNTNGIEGGTVFVYRAPKCEGCTGMIMGTAVHARFDARSKNEHKALGIFFKPVDFKSTFIQEDGKRIEVFSSVTVRIRK
ncbi:hypothetical protein LZ198_07225 [Myxococcus sp. K15C18031901]|uniref:hypothetical protein n=1 Tax=Myxococcus dinghuensis TaxID=2906761 RepID=UPI0020A7D6A1|nr:hypothetical protein [Myxococcus dinghuensis]MCP3098666.1 hypothetical protein [Myxococcus dinghuensis]